MSDIYPVLDEPLNVHNYQEKMHLLLHIEEYENLLELRNSDRVLVGFVQYIAQFSSHRRITIVHILSRVDVLKSQKNRRQSDCWSDFWTSKRMGLFLRKDAE